MTPSLKSMLCVIVLMKASPLFAHGQHNTENHAAATAITERALKLVQAYKAHPLRQAPEKLVFDFDDEKRRSIDFLPLISHTNTGVTLGLMKNSPALATHALLREMLSGEGYLRIQTIQSLENVLRYATPNESPLVRLPGAYSIQLFGNPTNKSPFGIKFEGHHVSLNVTIAHGQVRGTPLFLGANPAEVRVGPRRGLRALAPQQDYARQLLQSLDPTQMTRALQSKVKLEIRRGVLPPITQQTGLSAKNLSDEQRYLLFATIQSYTGMIRPSMAQAEMQRIEQAGLEQLHFIWNGSTEPEAKHYYRIQGPTVFIEYQALEGNHVHSLWRDPEQDFGRDLLLEHIESEHALLIDTPLSKDRMTL
jgi:hypothetical protein